jgi:hypothetical protein
MCTHAMGLMRGRFTGIIIADQIRGANLMLSSPHGPEVPSEHNSLLPDRASWSNRSRLAVTTLQKKVRSSRVYSMMITSSGNLKPAEN